MIPPPDLGPPADVERDDSRSGIEPIQSNILEAAYSDPDAHRTVLLEHGDDALLARIHLIRAARQSIDIQTFIWVYDHSGSWLYYELLQAARRGVKVRVLVDQFVSPGVTVDEYAGIVSAHENLEFRLYWPLTLNAINTSWGVIRNTFTRFSTMNHRMHNKILLVDGKVAIIGGRNVQDAYFDRDPGLTFRDRDVIVSGPACKDIQKSFKEFWQFDECYEASRMEDLKKSLEAGKATTLPAFGRPLEPFFHEIHELANNPDLSSSRPHLKSWEVSHIDFISDHPSKNPKFKPPHKMAPFKKAGDAMIAAESEILIQTPYAVINEKSYKEWKKLRQESGVRVKFSTNSLSSADHVYVGSIALKQRRRQIKALNIELYLAKPVPEDIREMVPRYNTLFHESASATHPNWEEDEDIMPLDIDGPRFCVHAKSMVIDRKTSLVGSHNFDPRSSNLNTECVVLIHNRPFAEEVAEKIEMGFDAKNSWIVGERRKAPIIGDLNAFISAISTSLPILDIWPIDAISCYELKEGLEPLSPYEENFHEHYNDVGPFPGLNIGLETIKVRLIRAIGAPAAGLM